MKDITPRDDELAFARQAERVGVTRADGFKLERLDVAAVAGLKRGVLLVAPGAARFSIGHGICRNCFVAISVRPKLLHSESLNGTPR